MLDVGCPNESNYRGRRIKTRATRANNEAGNIHSHERSENSRSTSDPKKNMETCIFIQRKHLLPVQDWHKLATMNSNRKFKIADLSSVLMACILFVLMLDRAVGNPQYIIMTGTDLLPAAGMIADLHSLQVDEAHRLETQIVNADTLTLSGAALNLTIRQFLLESITANPDLRYLLLLGDEITLPPIYTDTGSVPSDDFFTSLESQSALPQLATGRVPVHNLEDALQFTEKLVAYTIEPISGNWRNKIMLLADDTNKSNNNIIVEMTHVFYSNALYNTLKNNFNIKAVYGTDYTPQPGTGWLLQPEMTADALDNINSGIALLNYIGHGSPTTLADEQIIDMARDLNQINDPVNAIWVVGTCKFGWYDNKDAMSEALLVKPEGAIALVATSRDIQPSGNYAFLNNFFNGINGFVNNENDYRLGDIVAQSKNGGANEELFHVFGDPAMRLPFPRRYDLLDLEATSDTLRILDAAEVHLLNTEESDFNYLMINGPEQSILRTFHYNDGTQSLSYRLPGELIFQGEINQSAQVIIPMDIQFCDSCTAKISVYSDGYEDGAFFSRLDFKVDIPIVESDEEITDDTGPLIYLVQKDIVMKSPAVVFPPYELVLSFQDESGINLMGAMGHELRYWLDDEENAHIIISSFEYNSVTEGAVRLTLSGYEPGRHEMVVEAWDNVNNRTQDAYILYFTDEENFSIEYIFNYPNPFKDETFFTFQLSETAEVNINVFTPNGNSVIKLDAGILQSGYNSIFWDGKDAGGSGIANGAYLYTIEAKSLSGREFSSVEKLAKVK